MRCGYRLCGCRLRRLAVGLSHRTGVETAVCPRMVHVAVMRRIGRCRRGHHRRGHWRGHWCLRGGWSIVHVPLGQHGRSASGAGLLAFEPRPQAVEVEEMAAEQPFGCGHLLAADDAERVCARKLLGGRVREAAEPIHSALPIRSKRDMAARKPASPQVGFSRHCEAQLVRGRAAAAASIH